MTNPVNEEASGHITVHGEDGSPESYAIVTEASGAHRTVTMCPGADGAWPCGTDLGAAGQDGGVSFSSPAPGAEQGSTPTLRPYRADERRAVRNLLLAAFGASQEPEGK